jgi:hypothetical protein
VRTATRILRIFCRSAACSISYSAAVCRNCCITVGNVPIGCAVRLRFRYGIRGRPPGDGRWRFCWQHANAGDPVAAGMTMMDTTEGVLMSKACSGAFLNPLRKIFYTITTTGLSIVVAPLIGTIELLQVFITVGRLHGIHHRRPVSAGLGLVGGAGEIRPHRGTLWIATGSR